MAAVRREALVLLAYTLIGVAATFPLVRRLLTEVPRAGDSWLYVWNLWWVERALFELHVSPFFIPLLHAPYGASLHLSTLNILPGILAAPVTAMAGPVAAFNLWLLLSFTFGGYAAYRLALHVQRQPAFEAPAAALRAGAFVGGAIFSLSSYHFVHAFGHLDLASIQVLPLFALLFLKALESGRRRHIIGAGLVLAATAMTALQYVPMLLIWAVLFTAFAIDTRRAWMPVGALAGVVVTAAIVGAVLLWPMSVPGGTAQPAGDPAADITRVSADAAAFVRPAPLSIPGRLLVDWKSDGVLQTAEMEGVAALSLIALALAVVAMLARARGLSPWLVTALLFALLALGPIAHVVGRPLPTWTSVAMPYRLLAAVPYGEIGNVPGRYVVMVHLAVAMLAASGATALLTLRGGGAVAPAAVITALVFVENAVFPFPTAASGMPRYFATAAKDMSGRMLEVPIPDDPASFPVRMLYQTVHGRPIFGGYLGRGLMPPDFSAVPGFAQLKSLSASMDDVVSYDATTLMALGRVALVTYGAGDIVIEKRTMRGQDVARGREVASQLAGVDTPIVDDAQTLVYRVTAPAGAPPPGVWLDRGWSYLERGTAPDGRGRVERWRWMADTASMRVVSPGAEAALRVTLDVHAFRRERHLQIRLDQQPLGECVVTVEPTRCEMPEIRASAGVHDVELVSAEAAEQPGEDLRRISVAVSGVALTRAPSQEGRRP